ncbi:MAG: hypothetical protein J6X88_07500 [Bacteroidales bacterium]|nr:hypothetical protein [Bacteroidales bacterium]
MKSTTKHFLLLALMLIGAAGAAWAQTADPTTPVRQADGSWAFDMPAADKALNIEMLDSIVIAPGVSYTVAAGTVDPGNVYALGDSTVIYYSPATGVAPTLTLTATVPTGMVFDHWDDLASTAADYGVNPRSVTLDSSSCGTRFAATCITLYTLTLTAGNGGTLTVAPADGITPTATAGIYTVVDGTTVTVIADAAALHHVQGWVNEGNVAYPATAITYSGYAVTTPQNLFPDSSTLTLTVTGDTTARALFGINSYDVTASVAATTDVRGTVSASYTDVAGTAQTAGPAASVTFTAQGASTTTLTATPAAGYHFVYWAGATGDTLGTSTTLTTITALTATAHFDTTHADLAWSANAFTGYSMIDFNNWKPTLTNTHNVAVRYGCAEGGIIVDAQTGVIGSLSGVGHILIQTGTYHIYAVHDLTPEYFYDSVVYTLTVEHGVVVALMKNIDNAGTVGFTSYTATPTLTHLYGDSSSMAFVAHGNTVTVGAVANTGYHFVDWAAGNNDDGYTPFATTATVTCTIPNQVSTGLRADFDTNVYTMAYTVQNDTRATIGTGLPMGTVTLGGRHMHFLNDTLTATPAYGYLFDGWYVNGTLVSTSNPYTFSPTADTSFEARFVPDTFALATAVNIAASGSANGAGSYPYRTVVTLTETPAAGYHFVCWTAGTDTLGSAATLTVQLLGDTVVMANFDTTHAELAWSDTAFLGYSFIDFNTWKPTLTNPHSVAVRYGVVGNSVDIDAATGVIGMESTGYMGGHVVLLPGVYTVYAVHDLTQEYFYDSVTYTLTVERGVTTTLVKNLDEGGEVSYSTYTPVPTLTASYDTVNHIAGFFAHGTEVGILAQPATGYHFAGWMEQQVPGLYQILTSSPAYTYTLPNALAVNLRATFDTNVYNVVANVNIDGLGSVSGAGQVKHFLSTTLVATANLGYHFVRWTDTLGNELSTADSITVFPTGDTTLVAVFDTNIYTTLWAGADTTIYNSQPYTGLTASYLDFWGNEHTPQLTFVRGSETVTTPNYPVHAGVWTVTATGEIGDSLLDATTTLVILPATVYVSGAEAVVAKFADGTADAVVANQGILNNVQGNDAVTHTTVASFNDAAVGEGKTITLYYALVGEAAMLANYDLTPASEVFTTQGYIIEPMTPDTDRPGDDTTIVENGLDIYAYGYCLGGSYRVRYHLVSGVPDQYKLDFADSRFTDVDWTNLETAGPEGTILLDVPADLPTGDYSVTVTFRDSRFTWLESDPITVTFHVNLPETFTMPLFDNVIALVDTCHCFTDIQWYYRASADDEWHAIPGATGYYYRVPDGQLSGEFFVRAKYNGVETYTCPQTDMATLVTDGEQEVTVTAYPNPTTAKVTVTVEGSQVFDHTLRVMSSVGVEMENRTFEGATTAIDMQGYQSGTYMVSVDGVVVRVIKK